MAKKRTVNWEKIKIEYITTSISQRKLAEKYKVSFPTLRDRCKNEGWYAEKLQYRDKVVADAKDIIAKKDTDILVKEYDIACQFITLIEKSLNNDEFNFETLTDSTKVVNAAKALTSFMDIKRICKGHQTAKEKQAHDIAIRRLELEEKKADKENSIDKEIVVKLSNEVKEWTV